MAAYKPTKDSLYIERMIEDVKLNLKSLQIKIDELEFKRLHDLADQAMQMELLQLLSQQQELMQLIEQLQQQKLRALSDDDDIIALLMCLPI